VITFHSLEDRIGNRISHSACPGRALTKKLSRNRRRSAPKPRVLAARNSAPGRKVDGDRNSYEKRLLNTLSGKPIRKAPRLHRGDSARSFVSVRPLRFGWAAYQWIQYVIGSGSAEEKGAVIRNQPASAWSAAFLRNPEQLTRLPAASWAGRSAPGSL